MIKNHKLQSFGIENPLYSDKRNKKIYDKMYIQEENKMSKNKPDYEVCTPKVTKNKDGEEKTYWQRIGSAWKKDGKISISLNAHPIGDSIVLFKPKDEDD